jgi:hypothetical protein
VSNDPCTCGEAYDTEHSSDLSVRREGQKEGENYQHYPESDQETPHEVKPTAVRWSRSNARSFTPARSAE